jgi:hypothetical protein
MGNNFPAQGKITNRLFLIWKKEIPLMPDAEPDIEVDGANIMPI